MNEKTITENAKIKIWADGSINFVKTRRVITQAEAEDCFGKQSIRFYGVRDTLSTQRGHISVRRCGVNTIKRHNPNIVFQFKDDLFPVDAAGKAIDVTSGYAMPNFAALKSDFFAEGARVLFGSKFQRDIPKKDENIFEICPFHEAKYILISKEDYPADLLERKENAAYRSLVLRSEYAHEATPYGSFTGGTVVSYYVFRIEDRNFFQCPETENELAIYLSEYFSAEEVIAAFGETQEKGKLTEDETENFCFYRFDDGFSAEATWVIDARGRLIAPQPTIADNDETTSFIGATVARWEYWDKVNRECLVLRWKKPSISGKHEFRVEQLPEYLTWEQYERASSLQQAIRSEWSDKKSPIDGNLSPQLRAGWGLESPKKPE